METVISSVFLIFAIGFLSWFWYRTGEKRGYTKGVEKTLYKIKEEAHEMEKRKAKSW